MELYRGREDMGNIADRDVKTANMMDMLVEIELGNTKEVQQENELNRMIQTMTKEVEAIDGTPVKVSRFNLKFTPGSVEGSSPKFREYIDKFTMKKDTGYNVVAYDFSQKAILDADEKGYDIWAKALENTRGAREVYTNSLLPSKAVKALFAGASSATAIPAENIGGEYHDSPGALRGENVGDILNVGAKSSGTNKNHYLRLSNTAGITDIDLKRITATLRQYKTNTKRGIIAWANSEFISSLSAVYGHEDNKDDFIRQYVVSVKINGINFVAVDYLDPDFIIAMDFGKYIEGKILTKRVSPSKKQQGWALLPKKSLKDFVTGLEIEGAKLHVFPFEDYMFSRESVVIMDVNPSRGGDASNYVFNGANETALNNFLKALDAEYDDQAEIV